MSNYTMAQIPGMVVNEAANRLRRGRFHTSSWPTTPLLALHYGTCPKRSPCGSSSTLSHSPSSAPPNIGGHHKGFELFHQGYGITVLYLRFRYRFIVAQHGPQVFCLEQRHQQLHGGTHREKKELTKALATRTSGSGRYSNKKKPEKCPPHLTLWSPLGLLQQPRHPPRTTRLPSRPRTPRRHHLSFARPKHHRRSPSPPPFAVVG